MKHLLGAGTCAVLVGLSGIALLMSAAPAQACPYGTVQSSFDGVCVSGQGGGSMPDVVVPNSGPSIIGGGPNELPTVRGIPCTPQNIGTCMGLMENAGAQF